MIHARLILAIIILALILVVVGPAACNLIRSQQQQARVDHGQAKADIESGNVAVGTVAKAAKDAEATDRTVKESTNEVRTAPAGDSNDAADRATCRMRSYAHTERCRALLSADPS